MMVRRVVVAVVAAVTKGLGDDAAVVERLRKLEWELQVVQDGGSSDRTMLVAPGGKVGWCSEADVLAAPTSLPCHATRITRPRMLTCVRVPQLSTSVHSYLRTSSEPNRWSCTRPCCTGAEAARITRPCS